MTKSIPTRVLREHPDIDQLKREAKELLAAFIAGQAEAITEVNTHYRDADSNTFALHDAQLVLARAYGFDSWPKLKAYVEGVTSSRLCDAVEQGDLATARELLRRRPEIVNLDAPGRAEVHALHLAVMRRDAPMVQLLMESGADAQQGIWPHRASTGALQIAVDREYDEIVEIIKQEDRRRENEISNTEPAPAINVDIENSLNQAIRFGDHAVVLRILDAEPSLVYRALSTGWTWLHLAAGVLDEQMVKLLLERGAYVNARMHGNWTPLDFAASGKAWPDDEAPKRFPLVARMLLQAGAEMSSIAAVALGDTEWVRTRHAEGALVNATTINLWGPFGGLLSTALKHDRTEMFELLLDLGLDPDERVLLEGVDEIVYSRALPLYICAGSGRYELAEMLLKRGANPNAHVYASGTPVGHAYGVRDWEMIKLLERYGGVVYAANAGYYRDVDLARRLLALEDAHALPEGVADSGKTLVETLLESGATGGEPEIVRMALERIDWPREDRRWYWRMWDTFCFWNHMPGIPTANNDFDRGTYLECFRMILNRCDPNILPERSGASILHQVAAMRRHVTAKEAVQFATLLLDAGVRLDVRDDLFKSTPLGWACRWGRADLVKLLLERGADPIESDAEPWATPKAWAKKMDQTAIQALLG